MYVAVLPTARPELSATLPLAGLLNLGHVNATKTQVTEKTKLRFKQYLGAWILVYCIPPLGQVNTASVSFIAGVAPDARVLPHSVCNRPDGCE